MVRYENEIQSLQLLFESSVLSAAPTLASQSHSFLSLSLTASITIK